MLERTPPGFREYIDYRIWDKERQDEAHRVIGSDDDELHVPDDIDDVPVYDPEVEEDELDEDDLLAQ